MTPLFLLFLVLASCSTPVTVPATPKPATEATPRHIVGDPGLPSPYDVQLHNPPTAEETQEVYKRYFDITVARMQRNATAAQAFDPVVGAKAQQIVDAFRQLSPAMLTDFAADWTPVFSGHVCARPGEGHFSLMMMDDPTQTESPAAVWNARQKLLVMNPRFSPYEAYLPYTAFHEGFHMLDPRALNVVNLDYTNLEEPSPLEDDAIAFESRMLNAVTKGRYDRLIAGWAIGVQRGVYPAVVSREIIVPEAPIDFASIMTVSGEMQLETPSIMYQVMLYDVNIALLKGVKISDADRLRMDAQRYKRVSAALTDPAALQVVQYSLGDWLTR